MERGRAKFADFDVFANLRGDFLKIQLVGTKILILSCGPVHLLAGSSFSEARWPPDVRGGLGIVSLGGAWDRFPGVAWGLGIVSWPDQLLGFGVPARPTTRQNPYPTHPSFSRLHFSGGPLPPPFSLSARCSLLYPTTIRPYQMGAWVWCPGH